MKILAWAVGRIGVVRLYRITSLEGFLSLLLNGQERFVRPIDCWEDTYEGYMLHLLDSRDGMLRVLERLYSDISNQIVDVTIANFSKLLRSRYACYGLCWSKLSDSDALWRIYSYGGKAIQLVSSKERIEAMLLSGGWDRRHFDIYDVKYDIVDEEAAVNKILVRSAKIEAAYFHKRPAFLHEEEVRALITDVERHRDIEAFSSRAIKANIRFTDDEEGMPERILEAALYVDSRVNYLKVAPDQLFVNVSSLADYIEGVRVHPMAESWYVSLVNRLCEQYGLRFLGKSELYKKVV